MLSQPAERRTPQTPQDGGRANGTKQCTKCHETKPLEEFSPRKSARDGRQSWCRVCHNKHQREVSWKQQGIPPEAWPRLHKEATRHRRMRELAVRHGLKYCPDCNMCLGRGFFHRDSASKDGLFWRCKACQSAHFAAYLRTDAGRAANSGSEQRRRARLLELPTDGTGPRDWAAYAEEMEDFECHLCGGVLTEDDEIHWDHLDPISTGTTGTVLHNMHAAHARCNLMRGNRSLEEWFASVELP